jgi:hypothetical protein
MTKTILLVAVLAALAGGCAQALKTPFEVHRGTSKPKGPEQEASMDGERLRIQMACTREVVEFYCEGIDCDKPRTGPRQPRRWVERRSESAECEDHAVTLVSPWGTASSARPESDGSTSFVVDWGASEIEPLASDAISRLRGEWRLTAGEASFEWVPTEAVARMMLEAIATAVGVDMSLAQETRAVDLEVLELKLAEAKLRAGESSTLRLTIRNNGPGFAYRTAVQTRSSTPSLHGLHVSFGLIHPGASKSRDFRVRIPANETDTEARVVLLVENANDSKVRTTSHRFSIEPGEALPREGLQVGVRCHFQGHAGEARPEIDARRPVHVQCVLHNSGSRPAAVEVTASLEGTEQTRSRGVNVAPGKTQVVDLDFKVPADTQLGTALVVLASFSGEGLARGEPQRLTAVVGRPQVCPGARITREEYRRRHEALRGALASGALTQDEFDEYDAELILCIE